MTLLLLTSHALFFIGSFLIHTMTHRVGSIWHLRPRAAIYPRASTLGTLKNPRFPIVPERRNSH